MPKFFLPAAIFLFFPFFSQAASVEISEVAWMGTSNSAQDEWIELYSGSGANLEGWILKTVDDAMSIHLSGSIPAGGEILILTNSSGGEEDRVDASGGWQAGDNTTKDTMQKSSPTGWVTAPWTPKALNTTQASTPPSSTPSPTPTPTPTTGGSGGSANVTEETKTISAKITSEDVGISGADVFFYGSAFDFGGKEMVAQRYFWNFGDGKTALGRNVLHAYQFPGIYQVSLSISLGENSASGYKSVEIIPSEIFISEVIPGLDSWVELKNSSSKRIEITGWTIQSQGKNFSLPSGTFIGSSAFLVIPGDVSGISLADSGEVLLLYSSGKTADSFRYSGNLSSGQSFTRIGADIKITVASPGSGGGKIAQKIVAPTPSVKKIETTFKKNSVENIPAEAEIKIEPEAQTAQVSDSFFSGSILYWGLAAIGIGLLAGLGFLASRRV